MNAKTTALPFSVSYGLKAHAHPPFSTLLAWADAQQPNRMLWSAIAVTSQGCVFAPVATILACLAGLNASFVIVAMVSMALPLVTNLAALPTRITIPSFLFSVVVDLSIVAVALLTGCHFARIFA